MIWILLGLGVILILLFIYCCCVVASKADERLEE